MSRSICQIPARNSTALGRQPVLIAASRCYLIQMPDGIALHKRLSLLVAGQEK
jgi:hypothetical protein